jgi:tetratricopeptide (TPR) repeat protein
MGKNTDRNRIVDLALGKLSPEESLKLLEEIETDPDASRELELANTVLNFVHLHGEEVFGPEKASMPSKAIQWDAILLNGREFFRRKRFAYPAVVALGALAILGVLVTASHFSTSRYYRLTKIDEMEFDTRLRGPGQEDFVLASDYLLNRRYDESIRVLERYIRAFPRSDLLQFAHYSAGAVYLVSAHSSVVSLFPTYDRERVTRGLSHLSYAETGTSSIKLEEEARWLRAKGFLMLDEPDEALAELQRVVLLNGSRKREATDLISEIRRIYLKG